MPALRTISRDPAMWGEEGGAALVICSDGVWDAWSSAQQPHEQVAPNPNPNPNPNPTSNPNPNPNPNPTPTANPNPNPNPNPNQVARYVRDCSSAPQAAEKVVAKVAPPSTSTHTLHLHTPSPPPTPSTSKATKSRGP